MVGLELARHVRWLELDVLLRRRGTSAPPSSSARSNEHQSTSVLRDDCRYDAASRLPECPHPVGFDREVLRVRKLLLLGG
jgi:hypothetical protein